MKNKLTKEQRNKLQTFKIIFAEESASSYIDMMDESVELIVSNHPYWMLKTKKNDKVLWNEFIKLEIQLSNYRQFQIDCEVLQELPEFTCQLLNILVLEDIISMDNIKYLNSVCFES